MHDIHALDLETSSISGDLSDGYALEPWRARQGKGFITSLSVYGDKHRFQVLRPTREQLIQSLERLRGERVYAHFALFDVAWLIASIEPNKLARLHSAIKGIRWRDTALLAKWCINGRKADDMFFSYALLNLIDTFKKRMGYEGADEFIRMKQEEHLSAKDTQYWDKRGEMDVLWTYRLAKFLEEQLPPACHRGYAIEARCIPQIANSWLIGMRVDMAAFKRAEAKTEETIARIGAELGMSESVMSSPAQLGRVVFGQWGFQPLEYTKTGQPKADADTWILLTHSTGDPRLKKVLEGRQAITIKSKYIKTVYESLARTGDGYMYGKPMLFGTTSGRLTYSSYTMNKAMQVSIAQHQIPRKAKEVRAYLAPPDGSNVFETDAMAQESRIMGIWSRDSEIIRIFAEGTNFHSSMAAEIYGVAYEEFQARYKQEDPIEGGQYTEWRQMGKLTNLSCNFRIGGKNLAKKALTEYDTYMNEMEGRKLVNTFKRKYPGVPDYWNNIVAFARQNGYSYTLDQRRWKVPIEMLSGSDAWKVEGTVISHPIQGTGGGMFLAALSSVPDARIQTNMHDGIFWVVDEGPAGKEEAEHILDAMNRTNYQQLWDLSEPLPIPLLYEPSKIGTNYADVK
jgi:DNA polymerase I-like protein with 3'-5' exonuclease and polymerase domains